MLHVSIYKARGYRCRRKKDRGSGPYFTILDSSGKQALPADCRPKTSCGAWEELHELFLKGAVNE